MIENEEIQMVDKKEKISTTPPLSPKPKKAKRVNSSWSNIEREQDFHEQLQDYSRGRSDNRKRKKRDMSISSDLQSDEEFGGNASKWCKPEEVGDQRFSKDELSVFDISKTDYRAKVEEKFDNDKLEKAMGCRVIGEEVIICNTFAHEVDFLDFKEGCVKHKIPSLKYPTQDFKPDQPAQGTVLESGNKVILDSSGFVIFENEYKSGIQYWKKVALSKQYQTNGSKAKMFGLLPSRKKEIGTYIKDDQKGHLIVWLTSFTKDDGSLAPMSEWNIRETPLDELDRDAAIRFAAIHGNTIALMDMGRNPKIYLIDLG